MSRRMSVSILLLMLISSFGFQNCSEKPIDLNQPLSVSDVDVSTLDINGKVCLETDFKLVSLYVMNLSLKPNLDDLEIDADRDGLSDSFEARIGFDPDNPRSQGRLLDGVCFYLTQSNDCRDLEIICEGKVNEMGLSDCDINALSLQKNDSPQLGLDSDEDGIPDLIEVKYQLDPAVDDALLDYDSDGFTNIAETIRGSHPRQEESTKQNFSEHLFTQKVAPRNTDCEGEEWLFESKGQKIYDFGPRQIAESEYNHLWIMVLSENSNSVLEVERRLQYIAIKRKADFENETLSFSSDDFIFADNNFFRRASEQ